MTDDTWDDGVISAAELLSKNFGGEGVTPILGDDSEGVGPKLRPFIIKDLLRDGEVMNIIGQPKIGKGWFACDLATAIATGGKWLDHFKCQQGDILIVDTMLGKAETRFRLESLAKINDLDFEEVAEHICFKEYRGTIATFDDLDAFFKTIPAKTYKVIIINVFQHFVKPGQNEDDYGFAGRVYNMLDYHAKQLDCSIVQTHNTPNWYEPGEPVDLATASLGDTHILLHPHCELGVISVEAAAVSCEPIEPFCVRCEFPLLAVDLDLNPKDFKEL